MDPKWWQFGQGDEVDVETLYWSDVMPGDVVQSRGTRAYHMRDFIGRTHDTKVFFLHSSPVLVLSRTDGIPGEESTGDIRTFTVLSRHGILVIVQLVKKDDQD